jgi:2-oxoisovalerate dehydrogenase E2 component (dihydrolipoyl transacylase)
MSLHTIILPDVGEGIAEAELVEWSVTVGDRVNEDDVLAIVMTDKAAIEVPSSVSGKVMSLGGEVGEVLAIGSSLVEIEIEGGNGTELAEGGGAGADDGETQQVELRPDAIVETGMSSHETLLAEERIVEKEVAVLPSVVEEKSVQQFLDKDADTLKEPNVTSFRGDKVLASPAVRARAKRLDVDLGGVPGFGPLGRIRHEDLDDYLLGNKDLKAKPKITQRSLEGEVTEVKVIGMRRKIAEQMALSKSRIPHITLVEEVDVTPLEEFRAALNEKYASIRPKLTLLPFLMKAMVKALQEHPQFNGHYDDEKNVVRHNSTISIGMAAQTDNGLMVPVVKDVVGRSLWNCAEEITRLSSLARAGKIGTEDLGGGTITLSSLGSFGGIVSTPIINYPEVAIVGVNKIATRPFWDGEAFKPRKIMNLSSGFDHRIIDGFDAAHFVQKIKASLEAPYSLVD